MKVRNKETGATFEVDDDYYERFLKEREHIEVVAEEPREKRGDGEKRARSRA